jgi:5'-nucleotidase
MPLNTNYLIFKNLKSSLNNKILLFFVTVTIYSCVTNSTSEKLSIYGKNIPLNTSLDIDSSLQEIYLPYKKSLDSLMDLVLCYSPQFLEKTKPESALSNWMADVCLISVPEKQVDFCLLNYGGIRSTLPQGNISTKNIYELMPFENELVIVEIPVLKFEEVLNYLGQSSGHPISGIRLNFHGEKVRHSLSLNESVRILTSDYLANGGDQMYFFSDSISCERTNLKIRDVLLSHCEEIDTIHAFMDQRFSYDQ